jgi:hypothetical protein
MKDALNSPNITLYLLKCGGVVVKKMLWAVALVVAFG